MGEEDWLAAHLPRIYRLAWALTRRDADAEDLAHDTMVAALAGWRRFRGDAQVSTWLTGILVNRYRKACRAGAARERSNERLRSRNPPAPAAPPDEVIAAETRARVRDALARLDEEERLLIALSAEEDRTSERIGALLDIPAGTVRYRLHEARAKLRRWLQEAGRHEE